MHTINSSYRAAAATAISLTLLASCAHAPVRTDDGTRTPVAYTLRLAIQPGQEDAFRALMTEMVASTENEPGTLVYEWYFGDGGRTCHIHERFADTAAYRAHGEAFSAQFADRFMACVTIDGAAAYGNPDATAQEMLSGLNPAFFTPLGGFRR